MILGEHSGLGGPTLYAVMAMFLGRIITWNDVQSGVAFDVVGLYAASCAMGVGLSFTGGALWMAHAFVASMPDILTKGDNLAIGVSLLSGTMTNFMSDGATVAALGPIVLPMAALADVHPWKVGLACAFSSSFANALVVGTPNNAIAFAMCKDPETGERLMEVTDFIKYGVGVVFIAWRSSGSGPSSDTGGSCPGRQSSNPSSPYFPSSEELRREGNKDFLERNLSYGRCGAKFI